MSALYLAECKLLIIHDLDTSVPRGLLPYLGDSCTFQLSIHMYMIHTVNDRNVMKHPGNEICWGYPCLFSFRTGLHGRRKHKHQQNTQTGLLIVIASAWKKKIKTKKKKNNINLAHMF